MWSLKFIFVGEKICLREMRNSGHTKSKRKIENLNSKFLDPKISFYYLLFIWVQRFTLCSSIFLKRTERRP